jgi:hypothetical protein
MLPLVIISNEYAGDVYVSSEVARASQTSFIEEKNSFVCYSNSIMQVCMGDTSMIRAGWRNILMKCALPRSSVQRWVCQFAA